MPPGKDSNDYIDRLRQRVDAHLAINPAPSHLLRRFPVLRSDPKIDITALTEDPELQQSLAYLVQYTPSKWLLEQEAPLLADRRELHGQHLPRFQQNEDIYDWARKHPAHWRVLLRRRYPQRHLQSGDHPGPRSQGLARPGRLPVERLRRRLHPLLAGSLAQAQKHVTQGTQPSPT